MSMEEDDENFIADYCETHYILGAPGTSQAELIAVDMDKRKLCRTMIAHGRKAEQSRIWEDWLKLSTYQHDDTELKRIIFGGEGEKAKE